MPEKQSTNQSLTGEIIDSKEPLVQVTVPKPQIKTSVTFQQVLAQIPPIISEAKKLLNTNIEDLDKDGGEEVKLVNQKIREVNKYSKNIKEAEKEIRKRFNEPRDYVISQFRDRLEQAGFNELEDYTKQTKQLKRDIVNHRVNKRWDELKTTFDAALQAFPLIMNFDEHNPELTQVAQRLGDYARFRTLHPKLISGAQAKKVTDKTRSVVTNELAQYSSALTRIKQNDEKLLAPYQKHVLEVYVNEPTPDTLMDAINQMVAKQHADYLAHQAAVEAKKKAAQQAQTKPQATSQPQAKTIPTAQKQPTKQPTSTTPDYQWLADIIYSNKNFHNIHNNNKAKANLLYSMYNAINDRNSIWYKHIGLNADQMIAATKYILSL